MTNIELTKDHKIKLLKMCNKLFPEFNEWRFGKVIAEGNLEDFYNKTKDLPWKDREKYEQSCDFLWIEKDFKYEHDDDIERSETWVIHWFEFCVTHLAKKVLKNNYFRLTAFSNGVLFKNKQPIDILYQEFKKLK